MILGVTGHRPNKLGFYKIPNPIYDYVVQETEKKLLELKPEKLITGIALGFDTICAELCIKLNIPFVAAVPFLGQEKIWPDSSQKKYHQLLEKAVEKIIVSSGGYATFKLQIRNQFIVDNSDIILCCWDGSPGGTNNCINYTKSVKKEIIRINPLDWENQ